MTATPRINEACRIRIERVGRERSPVLVIDDLLADPAAFIDTAAMLPFTPVTHRAYPGIRASVPPGYGAAVHDFVRAAICDAFELHGCDVAASECSFSIVTTPPERLHVRQQFPHIDSTNLHLVALLHYLCRPEQGGTSFYRHRATGFETLTPERLPEFDRVIGTELAGFRPHGYINGDTAQFERIATFAAALNRMIVYRSATLHSGDIPADFRGDPDPRSGRLTANSFFMFGPAAARGSCAR
ncbi:MAG TPA: DUF6445 family protein [Steroidobacteraceae bacterium]|nr:DUF6445 family protein [Steroidobacteraceae bacterium]